jgi:protease PrsW
MSERAGVPMRWRFGARTGRRTGVVADTASAGKRSRWAWVAVLAGGAALFVALEQTLVQTQNPNYVPALLLVGALTVPAAFVSYVYGRSPLWTVSAGVLGVAGLAGGALGVIVAGLLEYDTLRTYGVLTTMGVGVIEEAAKLLVPLVLLITLRRHRTEADGLLIGVTVGAAFAALETMGYAFVVLLGSNGNVGLVQELLLERGLLSPAGHMAWTGLACAALYRAWGQWREGRAGLVFPVVFAVVVVLHGLWDGLATLPAYIVVGLVSLALLAAEVHRTVGRPWRHRAPARPE